MPDASVSAHMHPPSLGAGLEMADVDIATLADQSKHKMEVVWSGLIEWPLWSGLNSLFGSNCKFYVVDTILIFSQLKKWYFPFKTPQTLHIQHI